MPNSLTVTVSGWTINVSGAAPLVTVTGTLESDGSFVATGTGAVAGNTGIGVRFTGNLNAGVSGTGEGVMGANGGLPTGVPITYQVQ